MNDLENRARAVVVAGRDADSPSAADRERIKRAVLIQIAAGGAVASTAAAGTLSLGAKAGIAVLAVALVGGGAVGALKLRSQPVRSTRAPVAAPGPARVPAATAPGAPATDEAPALAPPEERSRRSEKPRRLAGPVSKADRSAADDPLAAEVAVLKRAREELRLGRPTAALATLAEYDQRFGHGVLGEERQAIAAIATCLATPGPAARTQAEDFMRRAPTSPLRERVRATCITPRRGTSP